MRTILQMVQITRNSHEPQGGVEIAEPFLRWAGSKRSHVDKIRACMPESFTRYFEPFVGSGALFFALRPEVAFLGDTLSPLIETFVAVRDHPSEVFDEISKWPVDRDTFYHLRAHQPESKIERAARFIYLNKTAWNGLYRVNRKGGFNVPYGLPKSSRIVTREQLLLSSSILANASLAAQDFEITLQGAGEGDLVFIDPPYVTSHKDNGFLEYNEKLFTWDDQVRLAELSRSLVEAGASVVVTNADHPSIRALYSEFEITEFWRSSTLAGSAKHRRRVSELILSGEGANRL
jgi:DNA adenine methylase